MQANREIWQSVAFPGSGAGEPGGTTAVEREALIAAATVKAWLGTGANKLPGGVDVLVALCAFEMGAETAVKLLQMCLGFQGKDIDGFQGPATTAAAASADPKGLVTEYSLAWVDFVKTAGMVDDVYLQRMHFDRELAIKLAPERASTVKAEHTVLKMIRAKWVGIGGVALTLVQPVIDAIPSARSAYASAAELLGPYEVVAPGISLAIGGVVIAVILYTHAKATRMSAVAVATGAVEVARA
jgi:lysozyme family protein